MESNENEQQANTFFGLEMGGMFTYAIVIVLTFVLIRQISALF